MNFRLIQIKSKFLQTTISYDENGRKFSKRVENTVRKGEIAHCEQFLLFPQHFQKTWIADTINLLKTGLVCERGKTVLWPVPIQFRIRHNCSVQPDLGLTDCVYFEKNCHSIFWRPLSACVFNCEREMNPITMLMITLTLLQTSPGFYLSAAQVFWKHVLGKGEIARYEQFLLFPHCFLPVWKTFCHFHRIWNCRL